LKKETYFRKSYCTFLQDLGMRLKVLVFSHLLFPSTPGIVSYEIVFSIPTSVLCATPQRFGKNSTSLQLQFHLMKLFPQAVNNVNLLWATQKNCVEVVEKMCGKLLR
jgi:hypothetical protein